MATAEPCDVLILGGGLAGLSLALQLKQARPQTSVVLVQAHKGRAREAAWKVGESTVELSCHYFMNVLGLKDHMETEHVHKAGLRFFFPAGDNSDLAQRVELGPSLHPPVPSYQLDRGRFENELMDRNEAVGVELIDGTLAQHIELGKDLHAVTLERDGTTFTRSARWVVDSAGRAFLLKRKLDLFEENDHAVNAAWFRLAGGLDIEDWVPDEDEQWYSRMQEKGIRPTSTNHLMGQGYWVWLIPLGSGPISIGVVSDPRFHPFERFGDFEGVLDWLREYEPQLAAAIDDRADQVADFLRLENFSYGAKRVFSPERWATTGEAGVFIDPFYSPGSDFIAISNTLITDMVTRDLDGEDVRERVEAHNDFYLRAYRNHMAFYQDQYVLWGNPNVMAAKIVSNNILYWGGNALLFFHGKLTDLEFMEEVRPDVERIWALNRRLEGLFREWHALEPREWHRAYVGVQSFPELIFRHVDLVAGFDDEALKAKLADNAALLEAVAIVTFFRAARELGEAAPDEDARVDPYAVSLDPDRWEQDGFYSDSGITLAEAREKAGGLEQLWMDVIAEPA